MNNKNMVVYRVWTRTCIRSNHGEAEPLFIEKFVNIGFFPFDTLNCYEHPRTFEQFIYPVLCYLFIHTSHDVKNCDIYQQVNFQFLNRKS